MSSFRSLARLRRAMVILPLTAVLLAGCGQAARPAPAPTSTSAPAAGAASPVASAVAVAPTTAAAAADPNRGIKFAPPVVFRTPVLTTVGVLATNTTNQVKTFTVKATFKNGDTIAATAAGAVTDLRPGEMRVASLVSPAAIPESFDSVRVDVDTMVRDTASTTTADAAAKFTFGPPAFQAAGGLTTINIEATNQDAAAHTLTVQVAFLKGGNLVAVTAGAITDIAPGQTKTTAFLVNGPLPEYDTFQVAVDTVVK